MIAYAILELRTRQIHRWPALVLLCAGMSGLLAGRTAVKAGGLALVEAARAHDVHRALSAAA